MDKYNGGIRSLLNAHCMAGSLADDLLGPDPWISQLVLGGRRVVSQHPQPHRKLEINSLDVIEPFPPSSPAVLPPTSVGSANGTVVGGRLVYIAVTPAAAGLGIG